MSSCQEALGLDGKIMCIVSYDYTSKNRVPGCCTKDVILNYTLLLMNLVVAYQTTLSHNRNSGHCRSCTDEHDNGNNRGTAAFSTAGRTKAFLSLIFVILFQIVLCLLVECTGISIIWCAIGGWILMDVHRNRIGGINSHPFSTSRSCHDNSGAEEGGSSLVVVLHQQHQATVLIVDVLVILYYAIVMEAITTLAHVLAITILGIPLYHASANVYEDADSNADEDGGNQEQELERERESLIQANHCENVLNEHESRGDRKIKGTNVHEGYNKISDCD